MGHGGKRPGAGRRPGALGAKTRAIAEAATASGVTPLEFMLQVLRDPEKDFAVRLDAAKAAAQYIHPRLASVESKVEARVGDLDQKDAATLKDIIAAELGSGKPESTTH